MTRLGVAALLGCLVGCADPYIESTTVLEDTVDTEGPYEVWSVAVGVDASDHLELRYVAGGADERPARMLDVEDDGDGPGELYRGAIPGQPAGTEIRYRVVVVAEGEVLAADPPGGDTFVFSVAP